MQVKFEESGTPLKRSRNRKGETCEEQLRRMCKNIANSISEPREITDEETGEKRQETASDWMEDVYDIRYIVDREKRYFSAELLVAGGGPTVWVSLNEMEVQGYWGGDRVNVPFADNLGLDDYCEEMYGC
jgi:hypothetical protein